MEANRFSDPLYQPSASMSQVDVLICIQMFPLHLLQNCVTLSLISGHDCSLRQKLWTYTVDLYFTSVQLLAVAWVYSKVACLILPSATLKLAALRNLELMFWCFLGFLPVSSTLIFFYLSLTQPTLLSVPYTFSADIDVQSLKWCHSISISATWSQSGSDVLIFVTRIAIITAISGVL